MSRDEITKEHFHNSYTIPLMFNSTTKSITRIIHDIALTSSLYRAGLSAAGTDVYIEASIPSPRALYLN